MKRRRVLDFSPTYKNTGELQFLYDKRFLFRSPLFLGKKYKWGYEERESLVRLLRITQQKEAWEFAIIEHYGGPLYVLKIYDPEKRTDGQPNFFMESESVNVFVAQACFYAIGYRKTLLDDIYGYSEGYTDVA